MKNNEGSSRQKTSKLLQSSNYKIFYVFIMQIIMCSLIGVLGASWQTSNNASHYYLNFTEEVSWLRLFLDNTGTWILLTHNFIPLYLISYLEVIKFYQAKFMAIDVLLIDNGVMPKVTV